MEKLPRYIPNINYNYQPHVVILGAGASLAAFPNGDKYGRKLPLMNNLVEIVGLERELHELGVNNVTGNFEEIFDHLNEAHKGNQKLNTIKERIFDYFKKFELPDELTVYDKLVLSLREKDLIATFNWDPFLGLAIQRNRHIKRLPNVAFLHGNVFAGVCMKDKTIGFVNCLCSKCGNLFENVDLLFPIKNKDYTSNEFIKEEWNLLKYKLDDAFMVTIFGYSAPQSDIAAREMLLNVWNNNVTKNFAQIELIDIRSKTDLETNWSDFFVRQHYSTTKSFNQSYLSIYPRRSCEAFASAVMMNDPWGDINQIRTTSLKKYQEWILKIIESEESHEFDNKIPLSRW